MKRFFGAMLGLTLGGIALFLMSADHIDAPAVTGGSADITDYYAFESPDDASSMTFAVSMQGLLSPTMTGQAAFDESVLLEINIDNTGDLIEDLVIQAIVRDGQVYAFAPAAPASTGATSTINASADRVSAAVTAYGASATVGSENGMKVFAGPRDDPFFFDLGAYQAILGGTAGGFSDPGNDTFAGTNVMAIVISVPKTMLGSAETINTWVETKVKQ